MSLQIRSNTFFIHPMRVAKATLYIKIEMTFFFLHFFLHAPFLEFMFIFISKSPCDSHDQILHTWAEQMVRGLCQFNRKY